MDGKIKTLFVLAVLIGLWPSCKEKKQATLYTSVPADSSGIRFSNLLNEKGPVNILEYLYYYNGAGVAAGDLNNDGLPDLYLASNETGNKLYLNKGNFRFEDITEASGTACENQWNTGVSMADVNGDGWLDIYVCAIGDYKSFNGQNRLYINNRDLTFTELSNQYGLDFKAFSTQAAWLDYDRDGDLDMYLLCHSIHSVETYRDTSIRRQADPQKGDRLMRNDGMKFTDVSPEAGILSSPLGYGLGVGVSDFNADGWPDILIGNDFHENDYLYINRQDGTFRQSQTLSFGHTSTFSMGSDIADINDDGFTDIVSLDMKPESEEVLKNSVGADPYDIYQYKADFGYHFQYPRNTLQLNTFIRPDGLPIFSEIGQLSNISRTDWSWTPLLADFDNSGSLDLFVANGIAHRPNDLDYLKYLAAPSASDTSDPGSLIQKMPDGRVRNYFFSQESPLLFTDRSALWNPEGPDLSTGAAYADFDLDGDLDLVINRINEPASLLRNETQPPGHSLRIKLEGQGLNPFAVGARVTLFQGDQKKTREIFPVRGFQSSSDYTVHFGLGSHTGIDSLLIRWPDGSLQRIEAVQPDRLNTIKQQDRKEGYAAPVSRETLFKAADPGIAYLHVENPYNDFEREKLLLYKLSTQGPGSAVADINGDGLEDLWIGGARGQAGITYLQTPSGSFTALAQNSLDLHASFEDVDGSWIDADQDGDPDLAVASAGYQMDQPALLVDRLYLNDGKGNLTFREDGFPAQAHMSACIAAHDLDQDGDTDLFIGGRVAPYYGFNTDSYFLINDGKGKFSVLEDPVTRGLGMVTDAVWADVDPTPGKELVVCGEWMPLTILSREGNRWKKRMIPSSSGLWQTVKAADLDGDGDQDLVAGNLGMNHDLKASPQHPVMIYPADFDQNASPEAPVSYYREGKDYSFFSKDELAGQLVFLKKKYTDYRSFSKQDFDQIFPKSRDDQNVRKVEITASAMFENKGDGHFTIIELPLEAQFSMVLALCLDEVSGDSLPDILLGGNLYETLPAFGRQDAGHGLLLLNQGKMAFRALPAEQSGVFIDGAVRDIEILHTGSSKKYLFVRNGATPVVLHR
ncbi:MAG TPA: VCBS repeat-containing protein [Saprospiraceae bacterium]|nr:VCBS repeat-containing protein [Saprospiraceae bacterium]HNT21703.1 VCBS repeat-containing protein [Saprospiraceae bacterium]